MPQIILNGSAHPCGEAQTVAELLETLELKAAQVAVERNKEILPRDEYAATQLVEGDQLEVVTFVGGG